MSPRVRGEGRIPVADRFWQKVDKSAANGCWLWTASKDSRGYGQFTLEHGQTPARAHRLAWELLKGPIPYGLSVLHRCDTPPCVNPEHLFLGTQADNMRDAVEKGRISRTHALGGPDHPNSKLTADAARAIYVRAASGESNNKLSKEFCVDRNVIRKILERRSYADATRDLA